MSEKKFPVEVADLGRLVRRVFETARHVVIEPAADRRVVVVYRAHVDDRAFFVRVAEAPGQDLRTDAQVLDWLGQLGVSVPSVLHVEADPAELDRSVMIVTEVPGISLARAGTDQEARRAARAAGRDTAVINSLRVDGFGWLRRTGLGRPLSAELGSYADFVVSDLPESLPGWLAGVFEPAHLEALEAIVESERQQVMDKGHLVHGDLDVTHIYLDRGRYQGIIDFGEMRGAEAYFDLGHFLLHDGETRASGLFEFFLAGYAEVAGPADHHREAIRRSAVLSGLRQLSLWLGPRRGWSATDLRVRFRAAQLGNLLEGKPAAQAR